MMGTNIFNGGHAKGGSGTDIKAGAVAITFNFVAGQFAIGQRAAIVRADIVNCVDLAIDIEEGDWLVFHLNKELLACRDF
jgi:hypothetical protein